MAGTARTHVVARYARRPQSCAALASYSWLALCGGWLTLPAAAIADPGSQLTIQIAQTLESGRNSARTRTSTQPGWTWLQIEVRNETYPLTVDIVGSTTAASKIIYMLPGGSTNFESSFFTPNDRNIVHFFCEKGYVVVGVTPREEKVPTSVGNFRFMESWGLSKHSTDVRSIVALIQNTLQLPYDVLGHSYGAATALDYAARYPGPDAPARLIVLDIYSLDVEADPTAQQAAQRTYQAHVELMNRGEYMDATYALIQPLAALASTSPGLDSGISRQLYGEAGNFSLESLLFVSLIDGARADGNHSALTGLPGDWLMQKGVVAGSYVFADDARSDRYALTRTTLSTVLDTVKVASSGLVPVALERDVWAINAAEPAYSIDWSAIDQEVIWMNTEYGYGPHRHGAKLIRDSGNSRVTDTQLLGYAHADLLWGEAARFDAWTQLAP